MDAESITTGGVEGLVKSCSQIKDTVVSEGYLQLRPGLMRLQSGSSQPIACLVAGGVLSDTKGRI